MKTFIQFAEAFNTPQCNEYTTWGWIDPTGKLIEPSKHQTQHGDILADMGMSMDQAYNAGYIRYFTMRCDDSSWFKIKSARKSIPVIIKYLKANILKGEIGIDTLRNKDVVFQNSREAILKLQAKMNSLKEAYNQCDYYTSWGFIDHEGELIKPEEGETNHGDLARTMGFAYSSKAMNAGYVRYYTSKHDGNSYFMYGCPKSIPAIIKYMKNNVLGGEITVENLDGGGPKDFKTEREAILKLQGGIMESAEPHAIVKVVVTKDQDGQDHHDILIKDADGHLCGNLELIDKGDHIKVQQSNIDKSHRYRGYGRRLYREAIALTKKLGKQWLISGYSVSDDAKACWRRIPGHIEFHEAPGSGPRFKIDVTKS